MQIEVMDGWVSAVGHHVRISLEMDPLLNLCHMKDLVCLLEMCCLFCLLLICVLFLLYFASSLKMPLWFFFFNTSTL